MLCIEAKGLKKEYADVDQVIRVLNGIDLKVESGEMICISGQSGCGKSTLLHILGLLDTPDEGELKLLDKAIPKSDKEMALFRNQAIGFVFQFHHLIEDLTASENVAIPAMIGGMKPSKALSLATKLLSEIGLSERTKHYPNQLSGGEQQRVALARALVNQPSIVFADEPTGNLDPAHGLEVFSLMKSLNEQSGQTFVIVTHDQRLTNFATTNYILQDGILIASN